MLCGVIGFFSVGSKLSGVYYVPNEKEQQDKPSPLLPLPGKKCRLFLAPAKPMAGVGVGA